MSTDAMHKVVQLDENELQELTQEVKETLVKNSTIDVRNTEMFTTLDMWNVLRQSRSASSKIRRWNN